MKDEARLLSGPNLARQITKATTGTKVRCAVAFWTVGGISRIFPDGVPSDAEVLCDISMGGTSEQALRDLSDALGGRLRHAPGMHAKLYLSSTGVVVASANASNVAISSDRTPGSRLEVGTFHRPDCAAYRSARRLFSRHFGKADVVGENEFLLARKIFKPQLGEDGLLPVRRASLIERVVLDPRAFRSTGFVFVSRNPTSEEREGVAKAAIKVGITKQALNEYRGGTFTGWRANDVKRWPRYFFEFWQPHRKLSVTGRRMDHCFKDEVSILAAVDWAGVARAAAVNLPRALDIGVADANISQQILEGEAGRFFANGDELADWLARHRVRVGDPE